MATTDHDRAGRGARSSSPFVGESAELEELVEGRMTFLSTSTSCASALRMPLALLAGFLIARVRQADLRFRLRPPRRRRPESHPDLYRARRGVLSLSEDRRALGLMASPYVMWQVAVHRARPVCQRKEIRAAVCVLRVRASSSPAPPSRTTSSSRSRGSSLPVLRRDASVHAASRADFGSTSS